MKRNETATPRESERGSEQGESSARLAQLQALVMGLTRQVERKEEEEDTLRRTLELRDMQMESALSTMGRVETLTDQVLFHSRRPTTNDPICFLSRPRPVSDAASLCFPSSRIRSALRARSVKGGKLRWRGSR